MRGLRNRTSDGCNNGSRGIGLRTAGIIIFCAAVLGIAALRWQTVLNSLGSFLVDRHPPQQADLILVLGGDFWGPRVVTGAELARMHYAPVALLSGPLYQGVPQGQMAIDFLTKKGYDSDLFQVFFADAHSTIAEANALRGELARRHVKRVLLVTASYHSRRATIVLTLFCPGVQFISIPAPDIHYHADEWWSDDESRRIFFSEWSKILGTVFMSYPRYLVSRSFGSVTGPSENEGYRHPIIDPFQRDGQPLKRTTLRILESVSDLHRGPRTGDGCLQGG